ncbi:hypothetical protein PMIN01_00920 [Paraphaeosphaeria minitans]|uniref:Uncharacterized protein n=1 Tax=Paraphaeosphaeria minitans TaxID=565426 RepID=A0A9P6GT51_9PLEO|nr:hypothetical protein PMIN01_00920 [Paraphaeosphaeria minitans]
MRGDIGLQIYSYFKKYLGIDYNNNNNNYINKHANIVNIIKDYNNFKKCFK